MKRYLDEKDRYEAFLAGQHGKEDGNGQTMSRNMQIWGKSWERQGGDCNPKQGMLRIKNLLMPSMILKSCRKA